MRRTEKCVFQGKKIFYAQPVKGLANDHVQADPAVLHLAGKIIIEFRSDLVAGWTNARPDRGNYVSRSFNSLVVKYCQGIGNDVLP